MATNKCSNLASKTKTISSSEMKSYIKIRAPRPGPKDQN